LLFAIADIADGVGSDRIRLTAEQKLVLLDVPAERVDEAAAAFESLGLFVRPSEFRRGAMACTGIEYCKLAIVETKARAADMVAELEDRLPTFDAPLSIHVNGCPNSCARFQVADIGFKGSLVTDDDGSTVEGFQVHLGGTLGGGVGLGRKLRAHKVTADELPVFVERVTSNYLEQREVDESFAVWATRADDADLR
ncbi:MAG: nitrite/sulfite reductase, partial [Candidatus Nanopelagicales bacterium]